MSILTVVSTYVIIASLLAIIFFAYPPTRISKHNRFEQTHRFLGWFTTAVVWAQNVSLTNDYRPTSVPLGRALLTSSSFWMVFILTASIVLPWLNLRKVVVKSEVLSNHAIRLSFDYVTPVAGSYTRISRDPLLEWHSFATVAEPGKKGYSLFVSRGGYWTGKTIEEPPTQLWVRGVVRSRRCRSPEHDTEEGLLCSQLAAFCGLSPSSERSCSSLQEAVLDHALHAF